MRNSATNFEIGGAKFHIKRAISEMGRAKFREILISGAQFANFPVWKILPVNKIFFLYISYIYERRKKAGSSTL
jgi:hypothetical protein